MPDIVCNDTRLWSLERQVEGVGSGCACEFASEKGRTNGVTAGGYDGMDFSSFLSLEDL